MRILISGLIISLGLIVSSCTRDGVAEYEAETQVPRMCMERDIWLDVENNRWVYDCAVWNY